MSFSFTGLFAFSCNSLFQGRYGLFSVLGDGKVFSVIDGADIGQQFVILFLLMIFLSMPVFRFFQHDTHACRKDDQADAVAESESGRTGDFGWRQ